MQQLTSEFAQDVCLKFFMTRKMTTSRIESSSVASSLVTNSCDTALSGTLRCAAGRLCVGVHPSFLRFRFSGRGGIHNRGVGVESQLGLERVVIPIFDMGLVFVIDYGLPNRTTEVSVACPIYTFINHGVGCVNQDCTVCRIKT